jgi:hypothetical protein
MGFLEKVENSSGTRPLLLFLCPHEVGEKFLEVALSLGNHLTEDNGLTSAPIFTALQVYFSMMRNPAAPGLMDLVQPDLEACKLYR